MNTKSVKLDYDTAYSKGLILSRSKDFYKKRLGLFILIGIQSGLRSKDILNIKKDMLEFEDEGMWIYFKAFKTKNVGRARIDNIIMEIVKEVMSETDQEFLFFNENYGCLLTHPWISSNLKKQFKKEYGIARRLGLTVGVHSLRKTAGTYFYEKGGLEIARKLLQHAKYSTTKTYIEESTDSFEQKVKAIISK